MISDEKTNFLYLADTLPKLYPEFWQHFKPLLEDHKISYAFLPGTKDIWCRDFMPVQTAENRFVQFLYQPDYLQNDKYCHTISDPAKICGQLGIVTIKSNIKLDGGNLVKLKNKAILTDKIYKENPHYEPAKLRARIQDLLEVEMLFIIPKQPYDFTGHADGMVRFLNENTLLVNDFSGESKNFQERLHNALKLTGLNLETFAYKPDLSFSKDSAVGNYINFMQIGKLILLPIFNKPEDEIALKQTKKLFPTCKIIPVLSNEIASEGGVLNCISLTIFK